MHQRTITSLTVFAPQAIKCSGLNDLQMVELQCACKTSHDQ